MLWLTAFAAAILFGPTFNGVLFYFFANISNAFGRKILKNKFISNYYFHILGISFKLEVKLFINSIFLAKFIYY